MVAGGTRSEVRRIRSRGGPMMCGIIACRTEGSAVEYLRVGGLRRLEYRGYDSVGMALRTTGGDIARLRTTGRIGAWKLCSTIGRAPPGSTGPGSAIRGGRPMAR